MGTTLSLLDLAGSVALLLWGLHMVQTGIQRAFGTELRRFLGMALGHRGKALLAGLGVTAILQSSTATGLMVSSFAAAGLVDLVPALATMLGANLGTTLIVQLLSFDVAGVASLAILVGVLMFRRGEESRTRDVGRVAIGLGLMLMALHQLLALVTPYEDVPSLRLMLGTVATDPTLAALVAAGITWAAHSSVAVVLLIMSFAAKGVVPPETAFAMVVGANLGTAINPLLESATGADGAARRLPVGNLVNRIVGAALVLPALPWVAPWIVTIEPDNGRAVADFHTGFNLVLAALFFPLLTPYAALLRKLLPERVAERDPSLPLYLGAAEREAPSVALAGAAREALRMADVLDAMLRAAGDALSAGDRKRIGEARRLDDVLDKLNTAIRAYLAKLDADAMIESDHRRLAQIFHFATNLEHAGDVVDQNIMAAAGKRLKRGVVLGVAEQAEIQGVIERLCTNLRRAAAVFMTEDLRAARELAAEKEAFRDLEAASTAAELAKLRDGHADALDTPVAAGALHVDLVRDFKRINTHLVSAAAYPVLEAEGTLLPSRLRQQD
jgi:phosphate:Na+ symporter